MSGFFVFGNGTTTTQRRTRNTKDIFLPISAQQRRQKPALLTASSTAFTGMRIEFQVLIFPVDSYGS